MVANENGRIAIGPLRSIPLFGCISEDDLQDIAAAGSLRIASSRANLFDEGDRVDHLLVLICGVVELFSEQDERRLTISVVRAVQPLEACSIHSERHPLSARVLQDSELLSIPTKLIIEVISRETSFANAFARELTSNRWK
jgi:CRP-like cAMP-binding protein